MAEHLSYVTAILITQGAKKVQENRTQIYPDHRFASVHLYWNSDQCAYNSLSIGPFIMHAL